MKYKKDFAFVLSCFCAFVFLPACSSGLRYGREAKLIKRGYELSARQNPKGECNVLMLGEVWQNVRDTFYKPLSNEQIFRFALQGLSSSVERSVDLPEYSDKKKYGPNHFWFLIDYISQFTDKNKSELCYASIRGIVSNLDDPYKSFYAPQKAMRAIGWMIEPKKYSSEPASVCKMLRDVPYCDLTIFDSRTMLSFFREFAKLPKHDKKIILDMRGSRGGLIDVACQALGAMWLGKKKAFIEVDRNGRREAKLAIPGKRLFLNNFRAVVLINRNTYSASEIFVSAIKDYKTAILVGETTHGKGMIQRNYFPSGAVLTISIRTILSPFGNAFNGKGVAPDIYVKDKNNAPLKKALEILKN
ncbi:S41 family peptidase [Patescibacteria group bacterium]|nr:S41 family peptidase [Patescibacteria group bacterium]